MATTVTYNGVVMHNVYTREWSEELQYDESHTDAMFHIFKLKFEGILYAVNSDPTVPTYTQPTQAASGLDMPANYQAVSLALQHPRGQLVVAVSDNEGNQSILLQCDPAPGDMTVAGANTAWNMANMHRDVNNGPKPTAFRVLQIIGNKCLRVAFEVECAKLKCSNTYLFNGSPVGFMPAVLSNRWTVQEAMDENHFTTRTISGKLRLSTAVPAPQVYSKSLTSPYLELGFRRNSIEYSVAKNGLECEYRIVDRQVHSSAPWPATKMDVRHSQSSGDGLNMRSEVHVELEGPPWASKKLLIARALQIIDAKLNFTQFQTSGAFLARYIPEFVSIVDYIGQANRVEATVRFLEIPPEDRYGKANIQDLVTNLRDNIGKPLSVPYAAGHMYDPAVSEKPALHGYYPPQGDKPTGSVRAPVVLAFLQCYLQQPCVDRHAIVSGNAGQTPSSATEEDPPDPVAIEVEEGQVTYVSAEDNWSATAKSSVYTTSRSTSRYETDESRVQLPKAIVQVEPVPDPPPDS